MKKHTAIYMAYFGYYEGVYMPCELPNCFAPATDIHHISARGLGGNPNGDKDVIENLQALCRDHHIAYGDKKQYKEYLTEVHLQFMKDFGKH